MVEQDSGSVRLNLQIRYEVGVMQFLGKFNRDAVDEMPRATAQHIVDVLLSEEVRFDRYCLGASELRTEEAALV